MEKVTFYIILPHARARRRRSTLICARGGSWGVRPHAADLCDVRVSARELLHDIPRTRAHELVCVSPTS